MDRKTKALFREIMREIGAQGGKIGGKRSLENMTPEERSARAKKPSMAAAKKRTADGAGGEADGAAWQESEHGQVKEPWRQDLVAVFLGWPRRLRILYGISKFAQGFAPVNHPGGGDQNSRRHVGQAFRYSERSRARTKC
jgi:hypothetical protein